MKLAVLLTHPVQYFAPVFRRLETFPGLELKVFFGVAHGARPGYDPNFKTVFSWDSAPVSGFSYEYICDAPLGYLSGVRGLLRSFRAARKLCDFKPDAVLVFAYSPEFIWFTTLLLGVHGVSLMLRAETSDSALDRGRVKDFLRTVLLRWFYKRFRYVFPIGINSAKHYSRMRVPKSRQIMATYAIDVDYFSPQAAKLLPERDLLRKQLGIPLDVHVIMYSGKMSPPKNPMIIAGALSGLSPEACSRVWVLAVGDGELRDRFQSSLSSVIPGRALFVGFKNQSELALYYSVADTLILPSEIGETWGLVVNEALQFGLNVIVSDHVGCAPDLVEHYSFGRIFKASDPESLARAIEDLMRMPMRARRQGTDLPHPNVFAEAILMALKRIQGH